MKAELSIGFEAGTDDSRSALRLTLEPERIDKRANLATLADIDAMTTMARSGLSARNRQVARCKWASWAPNGDLIVELKVRVWPSKPHMLYTLTAPAGVEAVGRGWMQLVRETKVWVSGARGRMDLPWWLYEGAEFELPLGAYDAWSRPAATPNIAHVVADAQPGMRGGAEIELRGDEAVSGVLGIRGTAVGFMHTLRIRYPTGNRENVISHGSDALFVAGGKGSNGPAVSVSSADDFEVTATWTDENGEPKTEKATVTIPECVKALLAECPEGGGEGGETFVVHHGEDEESGSVRVYYNSCNGNILAVKVSK